MGLYLYAFNVINVNRMNNGIGGKVGLIKELRHTFGLGLKEAKDIADELGNKGATTRELTVLLTHEACDMLRSVYGVDVRIVRSVEFTNTSEVEIPMVYAIFKNSDTTEGRGPMVLDSIFANRTAAVEYADAQPGIMGRRGKWSEEKYGDWEIREMPLFSLAEQKNAAVIAEQKARALSKLTPFERKLLGLE